MVQSGLEHCRFSIFRRISATTPAPERARLGAELQQLYAEGKFTEILAPWQRPAQRRGRQLHRRAGKIGCGARSAGLPGGEDAGDEQAKADRRSKASWAGWRATWGPKVEDLTPKTKAAELLRARLRGLFGGAQEEQQEAGQSIRPAGSRARLSGPSSRGRWASWGRCGRGSGRRMS